MVTLEKVRRDAPWSWLKAGWADFVRAPQVSLLYGLIFVGAGLLIITGLWSIDQTSLIPIAMSGFALVAPALAIGIYQVSRALERGEKPRFRIMITRYPSRLSQIGFMSVLLALLLMIWFRTAQFLYIGIVPAGSEFDLNAFIPFLLTEPKGLTLLVVGTAIGAILASLAFSISVLTFPMLVDQDVDAITALVASIRAVFTQPFVLLTWAWLIAFWVIAGSVVFIIGLAVTFPLLAHASWHAYKDFAPKPEIPAARSEV